MLKIIDKHLIKTFLAPFIFIFSVLFFIFIVNIVWIKLGQFIGKGLTYLEIIKLLFYLGVSVISLVTPLTILLSSIMCFGELGEKYELAAMKAAGISLTRIMKPLLILTIFISTLLFFFSNNIIPDFQRKAKNMLYNIATTKPALNFTEGQFLDQLPGYLIKFDKKNGVNGEKLEGIFIHKKANSYQDQQSIVAKKGLIVPAENSNYIKLLLFDGYIFEENLANQDYNKRKKQPDQAIQFDTLSSMFDVSELIKKAMEEEKITDDYRFKNYTELNKTIAEVKKENNATYESYNRDLVTQANAYVTYLDKSPKLKEIKKPKPKQQLNFTKLNKEKKLNVIFGAYNKLDNLKTTVENREKELNPVIKFYSKVVMYQQRIIAYSFTCIIFFMIGASLGSIIRKGGVGLPVVIAIIIFIVYHIITINIENLAWTGSLNPYIAAWMPNMILLPFGIWLTIKALKDSQLFDAEKYKIFFKPIIVLFTKSREHKRYQ